MTQTYPLALSDPVDATTDADQLGAVDRQIRTQIQELFNQLIGVSESVPIADPIVDGTTVRTLADLTTRVNSIATINPTDGRVPVRTGVGALGDSALVQTGVILSLANTFFFTLLKPAISVIRHATFAVNGTSALVGASAVYDPWAMKDVSGVYIQVPVSGDGVYLCFATITPAGAAHSGQVFNIKKSGPATIATAKMPGTVGVPQTGTGIVFGISTLVAGNQVTLDFVNLSAGYTADVTFGIAKLA